MKNIDQWRPTKYVFRGNKLRASRNKSHVGVGSRLIADLVAQCYDVNLKDHARGRLLDLGCGHVPLYEAYSPLISDVVCADWSNSLHQNSFLDVECDLSRKLPFESEDFDTVILSDVLEHIPAPEQLLEEISRILTLKGKLILNVPFLYWLHEEPHDYFRYTSFALRRLVENANLKLLHLQAIGGATEVMADIFSKCINAVPLFGPLLATIIQHSTQTFTTFGLGRRITNATSHKFPLGYFLVAEKS